LRVRTFICFSVISAVAASAASDEVRGVIENVAGISEESAVASEEVSAKLRASVARFRI
jgi:hypothetical protein